MELETRGPSGVLAAMPPDIGALFSRQVVDNTMEWDLLEERQVTPPYKPPVADERDLVNFDKQFTDEPVELTPDEPSILSKIDQSEFEGFEYINPLLMSMEESV